MAKYIAKATIEYARPDGSVAVVRAKDAKRGDTGEIADLDEKSAARLLAMGAIVADPTAEKVEAETAKAAADKAAAEEADKAAKAEKAAAEKAAKAEKAAAAKAAAAKAAKAEKATEDKGEDLL